MSLFLSRAGLSRTAVGRRLRLLPSQQLRFVLANIHSPSIESQELSAAELKITPSKIADGRRWH